MTERLVLLGRDHSLFGAVTARGTADGGGGLAISVGGDPAVAKWETKGDVRVPNEDACCVVDDGARVLIAVADSHFGHRASHGAIEAVAAGAVPESPDQLEELIGRLAALAPAADDSRSTLVIAVLERAIGAGFGVSFGDSTVATVDPGGVEVWTILADDYVAPGERATFDGAGHRFTLSVPEGALLVAFSDGVDHCGGEVARSVGASELTALRSRVGPSPADFARGLAELAIAGVRGHPGGYDNVAVVAVGR